MATGLGRLTVDMVMRTLGFEQGMTRAERITEQKSKAMQKQITLVSASITTAASAARAFAERLISTSIQTVDATAKMAQQIGVSTQALTGMRYAAQQFSSISDGNFELSLRRMARRVEEAAQGSGAAAGALRALGLEAKELTKLSPDQQFLRLSDAMSRVDGQGKKLGLTMKIFDSEGMPLVSALERGSDALLEMQQRAERLGLVLKDVDAGVIQDLASSRDELRRMFDSTMTNAVIGLAPALQQMAQDMIRFLEGIEDIGGKAAAVFSAFNSIIKITAGLLAARLAGSALSASAAFLVSAGSIAAAEFQMARANAMGITLSATYAAASLAARGLAIAMGLLGGPFGLLIAAVGGAYMAFRSGTQSNRDYASSLSDMGGTVDEVSEKLKQLSRDQQQSTLASATARIEQEKRALVDAVRDLEGEIAGAMAGQFRGTGKEFDEFVGKIQNAIDAGESLSDILQQAALRGQIPASTIQSVVDLSSNVQTARKNLADAEQTANTVKTALDNLAAGARNAASGMNDLDQRTLDAMAAGEKYAEQIGRRLTTAGISTELGRLNAQIKAGEILFKNEEDLLKVRRQAAEYDRRTAVTSKQINAEAEKRKNEMKSMLDRLLPLQKITRDYEDDQARLNQALSAGTIKGAAYAEAMNRLNKEREDAIKNLIPEEIKKMEELNRTLASGLSDFARQQERSIGAIVLPAQMRELADAMTQVEDKYRSMAEAMAATERGISEEELTALRSYMAAELTILEESYAKRQELNDSWLHGMNVGLQEYVDNVGSAAQNMQELMGSALGHVENALFDLVTTGEFNLRGLIQGLATDVIRMLIRMGLQMAVNFAMSKLFASTSAATAAATGSAMATAYAPAAALASLASFGGNSIPAMAGIMSTVGLTQGLAFAGMFDDGGTIPSGAFGIVGEIGPEIVEGPARITSRTDTARMLNGKRGDTIVQIIENPSRAGEVERFNDGEDEFVRVFVSDINNNGPMFQALSGATGLTRQGR